MDGAHMVGNHNYHNSLGFRSEKLRLCSLQSVKISRLEWSLDYSGFFFLGYFKGILGCPIFIAKYSQPPNLPIKCFFSSL